MSERNPLEELIGFVDERELERVQRASSAFRRDVACRASRTARALEALDDE